MSASHPSRRGWAARLADPRVWQSWLRRPSAWALLAVACVITIYSVKISGAGPWDPWETHYGEVARQIVVRHNPLDLWWRPGNAGPSFRAEGSFASKPALPFWCMALSLKVFGVGSSPDPAELVAPLWPVLAIRLPSMIVGMGAAFFLGAVVWRLVTPRAGIIVGLVLSTMPQWAMVARQALTDMFFVGPIVLAAGAWAMAWLQPDRDLRVRGTGRKQVPWDRAYAAFLALFVVVAVAPLAVLHQHAFDPGAWEAISKSVVKAKGLRDMQVHLFVYWAVGLVVLIRSLRWRRRSQVCMGILYLAAGVSLIGKGMIGPGVVGALVLAHLAVSGRWHLLLRCGLPTGIFLFALPAFPWHHAMILYRGDRWVAELIIQNNLRRFSTGEQDHAVGGFAFYLETLGLAALPWSAVVPVAVYRGMQSFVAHVAGEDEDSRATRARRDAEDHGASGLARFAMLWFLVSLLAICYSTTKYYHYSLPVLPPLALVVGLWIDAGLSGAKPSWRAGSVASALVSVAILVAVVRDALLTPTWLAHLTTYKYTGMWTKGAPEPDRLIVTCLPFVVGLVLWAIARGGRVRRYGAGAFLLSGLLTTGYVLVDYVPAASENWSQRTAIKIYFDERGPKDRLVSWWFYYRGETHLTKRDIVVMKEPEPKSMNALFDQHEGTGSALWFITVEPHAKRLASRVPKKYRERVEEMYRSFHYVMMRVQLDSELPAEVAPPD